MDILVSEQHVSSSAYREGLADNLTKPTVADRTLEEFLSFLEQNELPAIVTDATDTSITLSSINDAGVETHRVTVEVDSDDAAELSAYLAPYFGPEQA